MPRRADVLSNQRVPIIRSVQRPEELARGAMARSYGAELARGAMARCNGVELERGASARTMTWN